MGFGIVVRDGHGKFLVAQSKIELGESREAAMCRLCSIAAGPVGHV